MKLNPLNLTGAELVAYQLGRAAVLLGLFLLGALVAVAVFALAWTAWSVALFMLRDHPVLFAAVGLVGGTVAAWRAR